MPRAAVDDNKRMSLRVPPEAKARLVHAARLRHTDLTNFVTQAALREADAVIEADERLRLSDQAYRRLLALIENPPAPNARLLAAAKALPRSE
jgi:uncharacterized protein (DUF1778 family)